MMPVDKEKDDLAKSIKILATDDERLKSFGQMFANDSAREILLLLFNRELTAAQISQKMDISLQLTKYHLHKMQELGVVEVFRISKNSKSHDMKHYTAKRFSVVIVPPKLSEKTKHSRLLIHSFRHIYKVAGLGVATGVSGMFSALQLQQGSRSAFDSIPAAPTVGNTEGGEIEITGGAGSPRESEPTVGNTEGGEIEGGVGETAGQVVQEDSQQQQQQQDAMHADEPMPLQETSPTISDQSMMDDDTPQEKAATAEASDKDSTDDFAPAGKPSDAPEAAEPSDSIAVQVDASESGPEYAETLGDAAASAPFSSLDTFPELFLPMIAVTAVLGGLTAFYLAKYLKGS